MTLLPLELGFTPQHVSLQSAHVPLSLGGGLGVCVSAQEGSGRCPGLKRVVWEEQRPEAGRRPRPSVLSLLEGLRARLRNRTSG